jgi:hypothetical protein
VKGQPGRSPGRGTEEGMEPDNFLCTRNARPQKALVGHAQSRIGKAAFESEIEEWGEARSRHDDEET